MRLIDEEKLNGMTALAESSGRMRKNFNYHDGDNDLLQRMLNAFEPNTYVRPHAHVNPGKREVFIVLRGRLLVVFFDRHGKITKHIILDRDEGNYAVEIAPGEWHSATGLEKGTVVYEIKDGPYVQAEDKNFAAWSPEEGTEDARKILKKWLDELALIR